MVPILGFCGVSDSGKTTLLTAVVAELAGRGYAVGVIKHHGHPAPLTPGDPAHPKDSDRLAAAGAQRVALSHAGGLTLWASGPREAHQDPRAIAARHLADLDLVLVEGYKTAYIDKIEVVAPGRGPLLPAGGRLVALARRGGGAPEAGLTVLDADRPGEVAAFVLAHLGLAGARQDP